MHLLGITEHPSAAWAIQLARELAWDLSGTPPTCSPTWPGTGTGTGKFTGTFEAVFASIRINVIKTAPQCPQMNAFAERFKRTVRSECTDRMLIAGPRHLRAILDEFIAARSRTSRNRALLITLSWPVR